jgi:NAD+ synthase (glutamine-hydrolysing)
VIEFSHRYARMVERGTMPNLLRIAIAQQNFMVGDVANNVSKIIHIAEQARDELRADLVLFPELTLTGYPPEDLLLRPGLQKRVREGLEQVKAVKGIAIVVGYPEIRDDVQYNSAGLIHDGEIRAVYHKQQLPNYSVFDEKRYFQAGGDACVFDFKGTKIALSICEDMWHEGIMAQSGAAGAQLMLNLNASPFHIEKQRQREAIMRSRLQEAAMPIVYCNMVGGQDELVFDGQSFVMAADGAVTQRGEACTEGLYLAEFEIDKQPKPVPATIIEPLSIEASVYQVLVLGTRDYIEKNGFRGVVIGLSGGIDSALTLAIAVDAIGADRVEGVRMPSRYTADMSQEDAELEAQALGVECHTIAIEPAFNTFLDLLKDEFEGKPWDTTEENIQARCRGIILMAVSNKKRKIVLTTGNKSEMSVGYATLYGDMAGGYAPIKDVPKTLVYRLALYRNSLSPVIPERVIERPPSAELAPDQKDSDSLPPYDTLDPILEMYIEQDKCIEDIVATGYDEATVQRVAQMVIRNEYKRRQAPPGVRISRKAFGRDRRYPITSGYK